jgi:hypothetical protein
VSSVLGTFTTSENVPASPMSRSQFGSSSSLIAATSAAGFAYARLAGALTAPTAVAVVVGSRSAGRGLRRGGRRLVGGVAAAGAGALASRSRALGLPCRHWAGCRPGDRRRGDWRNGPCGDWRNGPCRDGRNRRPADTGLCELGAHLCAEAGGRSLRVPDPATFEPPTGARRRPHRPRARRSR